MARNQIEIAASVETVWSVLADPRLYAVWVVGAAAVRKVEGTWPEPGSAFHHTQAVMLRDTTSVVEADPPTHIRLEARTRPLLVVIVDVKLSAVSADRTHVVIEEWASDGPVAALPRPVTDAAIGLRNSIGLQRLKRLAEIAVSQPGARRD
jgi:uncharacterized protein YndB with AHSA1/START domain